MQIKWLMLVNCQLKYRHIDVEGYEPEYPEELKEREAINELFAGFDDTAEAEQSIISEGFDDCV